MNSSVLKQAVSEFTNKLLVFRLHKPKNTSQIIEKRK
jgi:hypothetical protein